MTRITILVAFAVFWLAAAVPVHALTAEQQLAFDVFKELVEINTVTATGDTARAADAVAARLRAAGFPAEDVHVFKPAPKKGNLVAKLREVGAEDGWGDSRCAHGCCTGGGAGRKDYADEEGETAALAEGRATPPAKSPDEPA